MQHHLRFDLLAKSGYLARGIVFVLIAGLAVFSGVAGGRPETKSALSTLLQQPLGRIWVGMIGLGLMAFVAWRLAQSLADVDNHGAGAKAMGIRAALLGSAVTYFGLSTYALSHALSFGSQSGSSGEKGLAHWVMSQPFGSYLAIAIGLGLVIGGAITAFKGISQKFRRYLNIEKDNRALTALCIYGLVARGVVFSITGILFTYAGIRVDPNEAGNMADALQWIHELPFGAALYMIVAIGLAAFGLYNVVEARYRIVRTPSLAGTKRSLPLRG